MMGATRESISHGRAFLRSPLARTRSRFCLATLPRPACPLLCVPRLAKRQPFIVVRICSSLCHARGAISALPRGVAYACLPACACLLTRPRELVFRTRLAAQTDHMCPVYRWLALPPPLTPGMLAVLSCTPCPYFCAGLTR